MNYKKVLKIIFGCFLVFCSVLSIFQTVTWQIAKKNYNKKYAYSDSGSLYYEENNEKIYIEKIYTSDGKLLHLDIPDKKTIIIYCYKDRPTEGIYLGMNNTPDSRLQNPIFNICIALFILTVALFILFRKHNENPIYNFYLFYVFAFIIGIILSTYQISTIVNYYSIKNDDNMVNATLYSDIYETGVSGGYKAAYYYYVNDNKYIYVEENYKSGNVDDVLGTSQILYYNPNNPEKAFSKPKLSNFVLLVLGIFITIITFPFVCFKNKMADNYDKAVKNSLNSNN